MRTNNKNPEKRSKTVIAGCALIGVLALCGGVILAVWLVISGLEDYRSQARLYQGIQVNTTAPQPYPYSADQQAVIQQRRYPESLTIYFYEEYNENGELQDVRFETWSYYTQGKMISFFNGELDQETDLEIITVQPLPLPYKSEQFQAYMSLEQVLATTGIDKVILTPLEKDLVSGGQVVYARMLSFGLKDGELRYVGTEALEED